MIEYVDSIPRDMRRNARGDSIYKDDVEGFLASGREFAEVISDKKPSSVAAGINSYTRRRGIGVKAFIRSGRVFVRLV